MIRIRNTYINEKKIIKILTAITFLVSGGYLTYKKMELIKEENEIMDGILARNLNLTKAIYEEEE